MCDRQIVPDYQEPDYLEVDMDLEWDSTDDMQFCSYCFDTKEPLAVYQTHYMYTLGGSVECPKLRREGCPKCGDAGDEAHVAERCYKMRVKRRGPIGVNKRSMKNKRTPSLRVQVLKKMTIKAMSSEMSEIQTTSNASTTKKVKRAKKRTKR